MPTTPALESAAAEVVRHISPTAYTFDPATILIVIQVIMAVLAACKPKTPADARRSAAVARRPLLGLVARHTVRNAVDEALADRGVTVASVGRAELRRRRDEIADAMIEAALTGDDETLRAVLAEVH